MGKLAEPYRRAVLAQEDSDILRIRPGRIRQLGTRQSDLAALPFLRKVEFALREVGAGQAGREAGTTTLAVVASGRLARFLVSIVAGTPMLMHHTARAARWLRRAA